MSDKTEKSSERMGWGGAAALAGAAIGSAALAAALLFANRRKAKPTDTPAHPEHAPETD
ncbi:MAG TPA: hypothetical protein VFF98_10450 [Novosphingobium sp.]|nr:hypothetical protein [Novosphingobium sp.]